MCYLLKKYFWWLLWRVKNLRSTACKHYRKCDVIYRYLHIELIWCLLMVQYLQNNVIMKWTTRFIHFTLKDGVLPSDWKKADVAPVFKKGAKDLAENYRPVSLTCVCCKILEHIISSHIRQHLDQHKILSKFQHGFRKFFSCETQLLVTVQDLLSFRDKNIQIDRPYWIFLKPLTPCRTDACWGNWATTG